jgi:hypothetical protein
MINNLLIDDYIFNAKYIVAIFVVIYLLFAISISITETNKTISSTIRSNTINSIKKLF